MVVVGDGAHAPTPSSGQGASLSIEDAVVLAMCLRDIPDRHDALRRYERVRRPRVERIIKQAARINSNKTAGPVGQRLRDALLPLVMKAVANSKQSTAHYAFHLDWGTPITGAAA